MVGSHIRQRPSSLWCGSLQGTLLAVTAAGLAVLYRCLVLGPYDARCTSRAVGGWLRDPNEAWILGEGSPEIDMQCDLKRLRASDLSPEAFERLHRGKRPLVLTGRGPGQGWTAAGRRRGPWFLCDSSSGSSSDSSSSSGGGGNACCQSDDDVWTLEGLRAALDESESEEGEEATALLRVVEDARELVRWWQWEQEQEGSCAAAGMEAGGGDNSGVMALTLDEYLSMGFGESSAKEEGEGEEREAEQEQEQQAEEEEEEVYLHDPFILQTHTGLAASALGQALPRPLSTAFPPATATSFIAVGRSRGGLPWHVVEEETWVGCVAGGFVQVWLYPPGRGLRNVTMGALGLAAGQTHPLLSPWEFVVHALPFLEHHGPDGPSSSSLPLEGESKEAPLSPSMVAPGDVPPLSCVLRPGDAIYIPAGGWKALRLHVGNALLVGATRAAASVEQRLEDSLAVLAQNPHDVEALLQAGLALAHPSSPSFDAEQALVHLRQAVALRPCDDGPHVALAEALWRLGEGGAGYRPQAIAALRVAEGLFALRGAAAEACPLPEWMPEERRRRLMAAARMRLARVWLRWGQDAEFTRALQEVVAVAGGEYGPARRALAALGGSN